MFVNERHSENSLVFTPADDRTKALPERHLHHVDEWDPPGYKKDGWNLASPILLLHYVAIRPIEIQYSQPSEITVPAGRVIPMATSACCRFRMPA